MKNEAVHNSFLIDSLVWKCYSRCFQQKLFRILCCAKFGWHLYWKRIRRKSCTELGTTVVITGSWGVGTWASILLHHGNSGTIIARFDIWFDCTVGNCQDSWQMLLTAALWVGYNTTQWPTSYSTILILCRRKQDLLFRDILAQCPMCGLLQLNLDFIPIILMLYLP